MARNYKLCDQLTEEMSELKSKKRMYEMELKEWNRKQGKTDEEETRIECDVCKISPILYRSIITTL
jgi:hypothetical protein